MADYGNSIATSNPYAALQGLSTATKKPGVGYNLQGQAVDVPDSSQLIDYNPNSLYAGASTYFKTPPIAPASGGGGYSTSGGGGGSFQGPGGGTFATAGQPVGSFSTTGSGTQVTGTVPISGNAYEQQQQTQLESQLASQSLQERAKLNAENQQRLLGVAGSYGGPALPREQMGGGGQMSTAEQAARNAAFARAKDQAGLIGNSALQGLTDIMGARGIHGSTIEQEGIGNVLAGAAGGQNQFNTEQLLQDLKRSGEVADTTYAGNITQRGQDIAQQQQRQSALLSLINSGSRLY
jgi:hypothetical protein